MINVFFDFTSTKKPAKEYLHRHFESVFIFIRVDPTQRNFYPRLYCLLTVHRIYLFGNGRSWVQLLDEQKCSVKNDVLGECNIFFWKQNKSHLNFLIPDADILVP